MGIKTTQKLPHWLTSIAVRAGCSAEEWSHLATLASHVVPGATVAVHVCPEKDIVCGDRPDRWCATCPKAAPPASALAEPVMYVSPKQLPGVEDPEGEFGKYLPVRKTPAGNFTLALYAAPPVSAPTVAWIRRHPDGSLTQELLTDAAIEPARKRSAAWLPLGIINLPAAELPEGAAEDDEQAHRLALALDNLDAAAQFWKRVKESDEDTSVNGAFRDALNWLRDAALAVVAARSTSKETT